MTTPATLQKLEFNVTAAGCVVQGTCAGGNGLTGYRAGLQTTLPEACRYG